MKHDLGSDSRDEGKITMGGVQGMNLMMMKERGMNYFI
jgi:hypothetical protein